RGCPAHRPARAPIAPAGLRRWAPPWRSGSMAASSGGGRMAWIDTVDRTVGATVAAARWLVLPVALILFLQWPLRDFVRWGWGPREATDLGQWVFALYVRLAVTFASRERAHLAVDAIAHDYSLRVRDALARWGTLLCVAPWSLFMLYATWPIAQRSAAQLEKF